MILKDESLVIQDFILYLNYIVKKKNATVSLSKENCKILLKHLRLYHNAVCYYARMSATCIHDDSSHCNFCPDAGKRARNALYFNYEQDKK